jgi:hypothetical protein
MARDNRDRLTAPMADGGKRPAFRALGHWNAEKFEFTGPDEEREWLAQAYRQSVHPDRWQGKPPVDAHTQSLLDDVPHLGAGQFFRGPDGKHRRITTDLREDKISKRSAVTPSIGSRKRALPGRNLANIPTTSRIQAKKRR